MLILVVDDDADTLDTMSVMIGMWGHQVRVAKDGTSALMSVKSECPDVVLFDVAMPCMSGLELAGKIRQEPGKRPVLIAVSGFADNASVQRSLEAGADMHLAKPVAPEVLHELLERVGG